MSKKYTFLSGFWLKIIAFITMTFDHVGWLLEENIDANYFLVQPFRTIGRLALPLFCFMIVEGVIHTKHFGKYMLRLGIMGTIVAITLIVLEYSSLFPGISNVRYEGNIFVDLILGALAVYLLKRKEPWLKALSVLPVIVSILSFVANCLENTGTLIDWFPFFLRMQYDWFSTLLCVGFYFAYILKDWSLKYHESLTGLDKEYLEGTFLERNLTNVYAAGMLIVCAMLLFLSSFMLATKYVYWDVGVQNTAMFSGAFILLYNGKRGYNAKWFEYGCYLYYPLHLLVIFGIGMLVL